MTSLLTTLLLDIVLTGLLGATIMLCWKLNNRIKVLQDSKSDIAQLIQQFDELTERATLSIADIHKASKRINENIQHKLDKANFIADDLHFMIEKGSKLADRMEGKAASPKGGNQRGGNNALEKELAARGGVSKRDSATMPQREGKAARKRRSDDSATAEQVDKQANAAVEGILDKLSGRKSGTAHAGGEQKAQRQGVRLRSKAEQELYDALKEAGNA